MSTLQSLVSVMVFVAILWFLAKAGLKSLNPGLPKKGSGKKAKGGGDAVANWTEKIILGVVRGAGRAMWTIATAPFRRRP